MENKHQELSQVELENSVGGKVGINLGGDIIKVAEKVFAGVCSFLDGWNKKNILVGVKVGLIE
ncbi:MULTISPECIES: hypothetical protein [Streptococcus]|nr:MULTISPECIES: hypothetical protein [Streptococcus]HEM6219579.1 hypothetical protein [Streptococcus suis]